MVRPATRKKTFQDGWLAATLEDSTLNIRSKKLNADHNKHLVAILLLRATSTIMVPVLSVVL